MYAVRLQPSTAVLSSHGTRAVFSSPLYHPVRLRGIVGQSKKTRHRIKQTKKLDLMFKVPLRAPPPQIKIKPKILLHL